MRAPPFISRWATGLFLGAGLILLAARAPAQQPILPPVAPSADQPLASPAPAGGETILGNPIQVQPDDLAPLYQNGPLALRPHFLYRLLYADGLQASLGHKSNSVINTFAPGLFVGLGSNWTVDYTPSWDLYSNSAFRNTVDQTLNVSGNESWETWSAQVGQSYLKTSQPLVETGAQTNEQDVLTSLAIAHTLSDRVAIEADLSQFLRYAEGFPDSKTWSDTDWLNYRLTPELSAGVGVGLGFVKVDGQPDSTYTNPEVRLAWKPGKKLTVSVDLGTEHREFYGHPKTGLTSPTYDAFIDYRIFEHTKLRVGGGRQIADSYFVGETSKNTYWNVSLEQRLLTHWNLSGGFGHDNTAYVATVIGPDEARRDNQTTFYARLGWTFIRRGTVSLLYNSTRDHSTAEDYGFTSNQFGIEMDYRF